MPTPNFYSQFLSSMPPTKQTDGEKKFYHRFESRRHTLGQKPTVKTISNTGLVGYHAGSYGKLAVKTVFSMGFLPLCHLLTNRRKKNFNAGLGIEQEVKKG
jgi:hypothetical protein